MIGNILRASVKAARVLGALGRLFPFSFPSHVAGSLRGLSWGHCPAQFAQTPHHSGGCAVGGEVKVGVMARVMWGPLRLIPDLGAVPFLTDGVRSTGSASTWRRATDALRENM